MSPLVPLAAAGILLDVRRGPVLVDSLYHELPQGDAGRQGAGHRGCDVLKTQLILVSDVDVLHRDLLSEPACVKTGAVRVVSVRANSASKKSRMLLRFFILGANEPLQSLS